VTTASEVIETLTGYDELDIETVTGRTLEDLAASGRNLHLTRALAAILVSRSKGLKYDEAYNEVMGTSQKDLAVVFEDEPHDVMPDAPDSAAGKDSSPSARKPRTSRGSARRPA
jgi:hypothetical protein